MSPSHPGVTADVIFSAADLAHLQELLRRQPP